MSTENLEISPAGERSIDWKFLIARLIEIVIGATLLAAGLLKAYEPLGFIGQIADYKIIAWHPLVVSIAWLMIVVECALGAALIVGYKRKIAVPAAVGLFLIFLGMVGWAWVTGATEDCGCFGSWVKRTPAEAFLEDSAMLAAVVVARLLSRTEPVRFARWRLGAVLVSALIGISITALASNSSRQSSDPAVRMRAQAGRQSPFADLKISGLPVDILKGRYVVVLMDTGCTHCQESVPAINRLSEQATDKFSIIALCSNGPDDVEYFNRKFNPRFPIGRISYDEFMRLFERGKTPRLIFLQDGAVTRIWDGVVPAISEIQ